jgi:hypothetical protein
MNKKSKLNLGFVDQKMARNQMIFFSTEEKHKIIQEMLSTGCTKRDIWEKYTGRLEEHGQIMKWMKKLGYVHDRSSGKPNFASNQIQMMKKNNPESNSETFETLQLKRRIEELERKLKEAEMKAIAFSTMIDIAEKELNVAIRKNYNTKPSKK